MRTFYPRKTIIVNASAPHPDGTQYKVSIGDEDWGDGTFQSVTKVQTMYDGKVAGRMSPSYPAETDDYERVCEAIFELESGHGNENTYMIPTMLTKEGLLTDLCEILGLVVTRNSISYKMMSVFEYMFFHLADNVKVFHDHKPEEANEVIDEMIGILKNLDTDDNMFPESEISFLESIR